MVWLINDDMGYEGISARLFNSDKEVLDYLDREFQYLDDINIYWVEKSYNAFEFLKEFRNA